MNLKKCAQWKLKPDTTKKNKTGKHVLTFPKFFHDFIHLTENLISHHSCS